MQSSPRAAIPRYARPFVAVFLATLVACPLASLNAWPFSSWRLFSALRSDRQTGWQAVAADVTGRERNYAVASVPHGYGGFAHIMRGFAQRSTADRRAICRVWLHHATSQFGPTTKLLRIYRLHWQLSDRHGDHAAPPKRTLAWTCSATEARAEV